MRKTGRVGRDIVQNRKIRPAIWKRKKTTEKKTDKESTKQKKSKLNNKI